MFVLKTSGFLDRPKLVESVGQPDRFDKLAVLLDHEVPLHQLGAGHHLLGQQEVVVLGGKISRHLSSWDAT